MMVRSLLATFAFSLLLVGCSSTPAEPLTTNGTTTPASNEAVSAETATVAIEGFKYAPETLTIKAGTTVTWTNNDTAPHTVTSDDGTKTLDSDDLMKGDTFSYTFTTPGTYTYFCAIHPSMKASVIVQ